MHVRTVLILLATSGFALAAELPLLHPLFADHMVFPREVAAPVWGWAAPDQAVTVSLGQKFARTAANRDGRWQVAIGPLDARSEPLTLTVKAGDTEKSITDVLVGDVWLCSGQSNMEWPTKLALNPEAELKAADHPLIRLFTVEKKTAFSPQPLCIGTWQVCSPESVAEFSAVGYFFGRDLEAAVRVPIGLIDSSWGGTLAEAWTSGEGLEPLGEFADGLTTVKRAVENSAEVDAEFWARVRQWTDARDPSPGEEGKPGWEHPDLDATSWNPVTLPALWPPQQLADFHGVTWLRRDFEAPVSWVGQAGRLNLGRTDHVPTVWINGTRVDAPPAIRTKHVLEIPVGLVKEGRNVIAVRLAGTGGQAGMQADPAKFAVAPAPEGGDRPALSLAGQWRWHTGLGRGSQDPFPSQLAGNPNVVTVLSNGMVEPLVPFAIKGAIWYQGESNAGRPAQYRRLLPALIGDWRRRFRVGDFPFLIVQLANFMARSEEPAESSWAELREAQSLTARRIPRAGQAVIIDVGEEKDIHPKNKQDVGKRLALEARRIAYGERIESRGPSLNSSLVENGRIRLIFDHADGGLVLKGDSKEPAGFAVAAQDGKFFRAKAEVSGTEVVVSAPEVEHPVNVRYAWANNPAVNLYNQAGLPIEPFRTDAPK
jgi:sialate O-acetylesterase